MPTADRLRHVRRLLVVLFCAGLAVLLLTAAISHVIPATGRQSYIVRGGSMEPTIPLGAVIAVRPVSADSVAVGDVVTLRTLDGVIVTHRVTAVIKASDGSILLATKGDANAFADTPEWPAQALVGRVDLWIPYAGYLMAFVATLPGLLALLCSMATLLLLIWGIDELRDERRALLRTATDAAAPG
jgi:signal peptidase I